MLIFAQGLNQFSRDARTWMVPAADLSAVRSAYLQHHFEFVWHPRNDLIETDSWFQSVQCSTSLQLAGATFVSSNIIPQILFDIPLSAVCTAEIAGLLYPLKVWFGHWSSHDVLVRWCQYGLSAAGLEHCYHLRLTWARHKIACLLPAKLQLRLQLQFYFKLQL